VICWVEKLPVSFLIRIRGWEGARGRREKCWLLLKLLRLLLAFGGEEELLHLLQASLLCNSHSILSILVADVEV